MKGGKVTKRHKVLMRLFAAVMLLILSHLFAFVFPNADAMYSNNIFAVPAVITGMLTSAFAALVLVFFAGVEYKHKKDKVKEETKQTV